MVYKEFDSVQNKFVEISKMDREFKNIELEKQLAEMKEREDRQRRESRQTVSRLDGSAM